MQQDLDVDQLIDGVIDREGGYVDHPADKVGPTCFGGQGERLRRANGQAAKGAGGGDLSPALLVETAPG